jgi:hypothetical protein
VRAILLGLLGISYAKAYEAAYGAIRGSQIREEEMEQRERVRKAQPPDFGTAFDLHSPHQLQRFKTFYECNEARLLRGGMCISSN